MNYLDRIAYDTGGYTVQEILSSFCNKILEIIDLVNKNEEVCDEAHTFIENIRNEVVPSLVENIIEEMQNNGYFNNLANVSIEQLRNELTTQLNNTITNFTNRLDNFNSQLDKKATINELESLKSRIDSLTKIQSVETEGNVELLDIRIDKNGTIHDTAGNATRVTILDDKSVSANKIAEEYIDLLQDTKIYINKSQSAYSTDTGLITRVGLDGHICTDVIPISLLGDEIIVPLDDNLKGQALIFLDADKKAYYSINANGIKSGADMKGYLFYNETNKQYKLLIKKYSQDIGRVAYASFNFLSTRKYIKKLADKKVLKWLKVESKNLTNECILPNHISNTEYLKDFAPIKNAYISGYESSKIYYSGTDNQVSTQDLDINELSDTLKFKVTSSLKGQIIVLKNNLNNYFVSLNAKLIRAKDFRQLTGYMTYDDTTEIATLDIKKIRAEVDINKINKIVISSDMAENIKGFVCKDIKWLRTSNKTDSKEEKIEIRLLEEYVLLKDVEYNFYTSQSVMCSRKLDEKYMVIWEYNGSGGTAYNDFIRIKETITATNNLTLKVFVEEDGTLTLVDSKTAKIKIVENNVTNKKLLFIGDSRIEDGSAPWTPRVQLVTTMKNVLDSSNVFLGSRGGGSLANHEGRSGWRSYDYCMTEHDSKRDYSNDFYNSNFTDTLDGLTSHFDFSYYMTNKGYDTVDLVGIYLGANDLYNDNSIIYQKMMIKSIKSFNPNIKIILFSDYLSPCDNYSLLSGGLNYINRRLSQMAYYEKQKKAITDLGYSDVYIIGTNNMIDDWYDFNRSTRKISYRNSDREKIEYIVDVIHPKASGYDKMADLVCGHINYILSN